MIFVLLFSALSVIVVGFSNNSADTAFSAVLAFVVVADFAKKKEAIAKDYQARLQAVDKSITETITNQAKAKGYDMVIS